MAHITESWTPLNFWQQIILNAAHLRELELSVNERNLSLSVFDREFHISIHVDTTPQVF